MGRITNIKLQRSSGTREMYKKYFVAYEGTSTEVKYFKELINQRCKNPNVRFFEIYKNRANGHSNLKGILDSILIDIENNKLEYTADALRDILIAELKGYDILVNESKIDSVIKKYYNNNNKSINEGCTSEDLRSILSELPKKIGLTIKNIDEIFSAIISKVEDNLKFFVGLDQLLIIGDRDRKSFVDSQYDSVISRNGTNGIEIYITNPCIEFWFLLHFKDCLEYNIEDLKDNPKISNTKTYVGNELAKITLNDVYNILNQDEALVKELTGMDYGRTKNKNKILGYTKTNIKTSLFLYLIDEAIKNSRNFSSDLIDLKDKPGTNIPELIKKLDDLSNN